MVHNRDDGTATGARMPVLPAGLYTTLTYLIAKMTDELIINTFASLGIAAFVW